MSLSFPKRCRLLIPAFLVICVPLILGSFLFSSRGDGRNVSLVTVGPGTPLRKVAAELQQKRIIGSASLFTAYARLSGTESRVKAGVYRFSDGMTAVEILRKMVAGDVYCRKFTVPEGYSIFQIADLLENQGLFRKDAFLKLCRDRSLLKELDIAGKSVEGYLYPCTYNIPPDMSGTDLIRMMVAQFKKVYKRRFAEQARASGLTRRELITLASMVEKEAVAPADRPLIASVFRNRLRRKMRLQSDPTAVYGIRDFGGSVSKSDIMRNTPYNTYLLDGLPPGPIGNPGNEAIEAVLNPAKTDYLYFVSKKDGHHYFSSTLEQHNKAVRTYLRSS